MNDYRGVEQRRRFEAVLVTEVGADQQATLCADRLTCWHIATDLLEALLQNSPEPPVAVSEGLHNAREFGLHVLPLHAEHAIDNPRCPRDVGQLEITRLHCWQIGAEQHTGRIGSKPDRQPTQFDKAYDITELR